MNKEYPKAFAIYNNDLEVRMKSTSGGMFSALAEYFITQKHAIVYGAAYDDSFNVVHTRIVELEDISLLRGSKYPQSSLGTTYKNVKNDLEFGYSVFFVGTPCQVVGLKRFLNNRNIENLYTMDFICHGVASQLIWQSYIKEFAKKKPIQNVIFKSKPYGWKKWYFRVEFYDGSFYHIRGSMNRFMASFLSYVNVRPSCYECQFKGLSRISDFTISDCWGIGEENKKLNDNKGLSALLIHNQRAENIFDTIRYQTTYQEYEPQTLMQGNWTTFKSVPRNPIRDEFFFSVLDIGPSKSLKKYFTPPLKEWLRYYYMKFIGLEK
mgnify:CR=1 FL=1